jgi:cysteinyl-tRNA synthetase
MKIKDKYIDELVDMRENARYNKNWKLADKIRDLLDTKHVFVFDTKEGQVIYH